jgi:hypothetical protein
MRRGQLVAVGTEDNTREKGAGAEPGVRREGRVDLRGEGRLVPHWLRRGMEWGNEVWGSCIR